MVCAPLNFDGTVGPSFARYDVGSDGGNGGGPFDIECPDNFAMVEIKGDAGTYVESASIRCQKAPFAGVAATEFDPGISAGKTGGQPYVWPQACTGKSVIDAMNVYHGQFVDTLSVYCVFINNP